MKRLLFLTCLFAYCALLPAQEHLMFMGIPLTGTINQFQTKLQAKGVRHDRQLSNELPRGTRAFKGTFSNRKANISVYYNSKTLLVYAAKAYIPDLTEENANELFELFKHNLLTKYADGIANDEDEDSFIIYVPNKAYDRAIGYISLYIWKDESYYNYPYLYSVHIQYNDWINSVKNDNVTLEDY